jgi:O-antigen ligase
LSLTSTDSGFASRNSFSARDIARRSSPGAVTWAAVSDGLITLAFGLALFRSTGMWFGYPSSQSEQALVDSSIQQFMLYALVPILATQFIVKQQYLVRTLKYVRWPIAVFMVMVCLSVVFSANVTSSARGLIAVVLLTIPPLLYKERFGPEKFMAFLQNAAMIMIAVNLVYIVAFPHYGIMGGSLAGSARGLFLHKNVFGQVAALSFVLLLPIGLPHRTSVLRKGMLALFSLLALACVALSLSSTALLTSALGFAIFSGSLMIAASGARPVRAYLVVAAIFLAGSVAYILGAMLMESFLLSVGKDLTLSGRTEIWGALLYAIAERPIFGHGFAMFRQPDYIGLYTSHLSWVIRSTHNTYIEMALNVGLPAALIWVGFLLSRLFAKLGVRQVDKDSRGIQAREAAIIASVMIGSFSEAGMMLGPMILWVLLVGALSNTQGYWAKGKWAP